MWREPVKKMIARGDGNQGLRGGSETCLRRANKDIFE